MKMQNVKMMLVPFNAQDVIATSGGGSDPFITFKNFGNSSMGDNSIKISGEPCYYDELSSTGFASLLNTVFKTNGITTGTTFGNVPISDIDNAYASDNSKFEVLNGTWKWISNEFVKQPQ